MHYAEGLRAPYTQCTNNHPCGGKSEGPSLKKNVKIIIKLYKNQILTSNLDLVLLELGPLDVTLVLVFRFSVSKKLSKNDKMLIKI